jgi:hypothetical protein
MLSKALLFLPGFLLLPNGASHGPSRVGDCGYYASGCSRVWTSEVNPTMQHLRDAKERGDVATMYRATVPALRDAEDSWCSDLADADRDIGPFYHREDIHRVERLRNLPRSPAVIGARVVFHARPGMNAPWLQRVVDCHLARCAAIRASDPELPFCGLALRGVTAQVASVPGGLAVEVVAPDRPTADLVLRRARDLIRAR